jgi:hypothetical protein
MFPDVRLMIAATLASVVALFCGLGLFAAFQVSHEPLVRLPSASAPQQLSVDNAATPMAYAAPEPFDRRFQISEPSDAAEAVEALARAIDHRESIQSALSPAPEPAPEAAVIAEAPAASPDGAKPGPALPAIAPASGVAAIVPSAEQPLPEQQLKPGNGAAPASVTKSVADTEKADTAAAKEPRHRHARVRHAKIASRKPKEPGSATGGPLVSAPSQ